MKQRPAGFDEAMLVDALRDDWGIAADELEYLALGFGGHHWRAAAAGAAWFLTVNDIHEIDQLQPAFAAARWLEVSAGMEFVVGPRPARTGELVQPLGRRFALSVYPWLDQVQPMHDPDGVLTAGLLKRLHAVALPRGLARTEDFILPRRRQLEMVLADTDAAWDGGPYGPAARAVAREYGAGIRKLLQLYDRLVELTPREEWVITHGEPYGANLLSDERHKLYLVDWDSALYAPRERDLWGAAADRISAHGIRPGGRRAGNALVPSLVCVGGAGAVSGAVSRSTSGRRQRRAVVGECAPVSADGRDLARVH